MVCVLLWTVVRDLDEMVSLSMENNEWFLPAEVEDDKNHRNSYIFY